MNSLVLSFFLALTLLTRIPLPYIKRLDQAEIEESTYALSTLWYPVIGILLACILYVVFLMLSYLNLPTAVTASLLICTWVGLTGALHLDGFADCVDALYAAHRSPQKVLDIMREPHCGSMAIVFTLLLLLVKFNTLQHLLKIQSNLFVLLIFTLVFSRLAALFLMLATPYVRTSGLADKLDPSKFRVQILFISVAVVAIALLLTSTSFVFSILVSLTLLFFWWRYKWKKIIGGYTGDCVGALIVLSETVILLVAVISL